MKKKYDIKVDDIDKVYGFYEWNKPCMFIKKDDERFNDFKLDKKNTGISPDQLWSFYYSICIFILPRLKAFREQIEFCKSHPCGITIEEWLSILDKMIFSFDACMKDVFIEDERERKEYLDKVQEGLNLFAEYFQALWY